MWIYVCLIVVVLPMAVVESRKGCWSDGTRPGDVCIYGTVIEGSHGLGIRYSFTSRFVMICCQALKCEYGKGCSMVDIGCGKSENSGPIQSPILPWEVRDVEPIMRCHDKTPDTYYSYTVALESIPATTSNRN